MTSCTMAWWSEIYFVDLMIEDCLLVEIKVAMTLNDLHVAQCINYLKASDLNLCLYSFRQTTPGNQTPGQSPLNLRASACIRSDLR